MLNSLDKARPLGLLMLRLGLAVIFLYHGYGKLFGDPQGAMAAFAKIGLPAWMALLAGVIEFFGACLLAAGFYTRPAALLIAACMAVAIWKVHSGKGILAVTEYEFPMALMVGALALATTGAGTISLDYALFRQKA